VKVRWILCGVYAFICALVVAGVPARTGSGGSASTGSTATASTTETAAGSAAKLKQAADDLQKKFVSQIAAVQKLAKVVSDDSLAQVQNLQDKLKADATQLKTTGEARFKVFQSDAKAVHESIDSYRAVVKKSEDKDYAKAVTQLQDLKDKVEKQGLTGIEDEKAKAETLIKQLSDSKALADADTGVKKSLQDLGNSGKELSDRLRERVVALKLSSAKTDDSKKEDAPSVRTGLRDALVADMDGLGTTLRKFGALESAADNLKGVDEAQPFLKAFGTSDGAENHVGESASSGSKTVTTRAGMPITPGKKPKKPMAKKDPASNKKAATAPSKGDSDKTKAATTSTPATTKATKAKIDTLVAAMDCLLSTNGNNAGKLIKALDAVSAYDKDLVPQISDVVSDLTSHNKPPFPSEPLLGQLRPHVEMLHKLRLGLDDLALALRETSRYGSVADDVVSHSKTLNAQDLVLRSLLDLVDAGIGENLDGFVQDQIRLYYFSEVNRLMKTLNQDTQTINPAETDLTKSASDARKNLRDAQETVAKDLRKMYDLRVRQSEIEAEIKKVKDKADKADRALRDSQDQTAQLNDLKTRLTDEKKLSDDDLKNSTTKADKDKYTARSAGLQRRLDRLGTEETIQTRTQDQAKTDADAADKQLKDLNSEKGGLPDQLAEAKKDGDAAQADLAAQRFIARDLGQAEVEAFAQARDNQPFYLSRPIPGSTDPVRRVLLYGYGDSNTLFIRGAAQDVHKVKEIIAGFDTPAPQARISLYTLQLNGSDSTTGIFGRRLAGAEKIDRAVADVNRELRDLRANILQLQDDLRHSITAEVGRVAAVGKLSVGDAKNAISERMFRYLYYPVEIRQRLGCGFHIPSERRLAASIDRDLYQAKLDFDAARGAAPISSDTPGDGGGKDADAGMTQSRIAALRRCRLHAYEAWKDLVELLEGPESKKAECLIDNSKCTRTSLECFLNDSDRILLTFDTDTRDAKTSADSKTFEAEKRQVMDQLPKKLKQDLDDFVDLHRYAFTNLAPHLLSSLPTKTPYFTASGGLHSSEYITQWTLPDPVESTTLGEMIFLVSLGRKSSRERIVADFIERATERYFVNHPLRDTSEETQSDSLGKLVSSIWKTAYKNKVLGTSGKVTDPAELAGIYPGFPNALLGSDTSSHVRGDDELSSNQLEVLLALETKAKGTVSSEIRTLIREIYAHSQDADSNKMLRDQYIPLVGWLTSHFQGFELGEKNLWANHNGVKANKDGDIFAMASADWVDAPKNPATLKGDEVPLPAPLTFQYYNALPPKSYENLGKEAVGSISEKYGAEADHRAWNIAQVVGNRNALSRSTPRVAAADDMLKRMIITVENDLDHFFVQDAFDHIRARIRANGVQFGSLEHESILATNRLVARVDPNANADLELPAGTDILGAATQLGSLAEHLRPEAVKSAASTAAIGLGAGIIKKQGFTNPWSLGGVMGILSFLQDQEPDQRGDVYSINGGNMFKVTPIFDPSGQALRFKFDYQASTIIQEPNGSRNRQIPQVDRHAVNTEVQLTNLEFREISRFSLNAKLGTPDERRGGIPLLKDLPVIRDIPLLGYFYRRNAQAAVRQESLIFAQTSIYPTVADIVNLVVNVPPREDYEEPAPWEGHEAPAASAPTQPRPSAVSSEYEPNDDERHAVAMGGASAGSGTIESDMDEDFWSKTLAPGEYVLDLSQAQPNVDHASLIVGMNETPLKNDQMGTLRRFTVPKRMRVFFTFSGNASHKGPYTFSINAAP
jgi:hypothetical protein